jgi:predicted transglutaminase-like cysteine proteinase
MLLMTLALVQVNAFDLNRLMQSFRALNGNPTSISEWNVMMQTYTDAPIETRLQKVNEFFNRKILYYDDQEAWGQSDYWATPMESLAKGKGDCEDYVIAKYFALRNMNIPDSQLRLIYVKARIGGSGSNIQQAHMVLAFYASADAEPRILDNLISEIRPASRRPDLLPIFSFNSQGVFAGAAANATVGPGGTGRLSRWQDLLERARREGFE